MTTPPNEPTTDICQCGRTKVAYDIEDIPGTAVICPGCHLEEATAGALDERAALPDDKMLYAAFKDSSSLMRIAAQEPEDCRLPTRPRQRLMLQLQLMLEHACFSFGQRELQQELDRNGHTCAESISLQTWIDLFRNDKTFKTENNDKSLSNLLSSVGKIQNVIIHRLDLDFFEVNQFLLNAEELIRLLDTPLYLDAVKPLRQRVEEVLLMAYRDAASIRKEADRKVAEIEAQRERLNLEEQGVKRHRDENLDNIRDSIERGVFTAMGQAKDALPDIGLAENR